MKGYKHILAQSELKSGRIYISESAVTELMRVLGQIRDRPFNIFRSDGRLLRRAVVIQKRTDRAGFRLDFGQQAFADCTEGTPIWIRTIEDGDVEVQIGSPAGPIIDNELSQECLAILEDPKADSYWLAVSTACIILESRLRSRTKSSGLYGKRLVDYALGYPDGKLICRENKAEQEGIYHLCLGVMQALRNPNLHQKHSISRIRARQIVGIVDLLLGEIDTAEERTE